ncbi:MAG: hypothetical protein HY784_12940 [Chloroflexi bacterium]|nr:hypothetical protein [Chloroflexota bacterium]
MGDLLPLLPSGTQALSGLERLAAFSAAAAPEGSAVIAQGTLAADAVTIASADSAPLIVSRRSGFGQVTFLAADPAFAPLRGWDGFEGLFRNLLAVPPDRPTWAGGFRNWSSAEQAINALPTLQLPSTFQICGFLFIYLVVIGPLNYLVLKRLRRRELAWLTIPGIVVFFSAATYLSGYQLRGTRATLHQLTLVQVWTDSDRAQVDQLVGLFSPRRTSYDVQFAPGFLARPLPSASSYTSAPRSIIVEQGDSTSLKNLLSDVGGVEAFVAQGQMPAPRFESQLALEVSHNAIRLTGTVTNLSDLTLTDVVLLAPGGPGGVQRLGDLRPGQTQNVSILLPASRATQAPVNIVTPALLHATRAAGTPAPYAPPNAYDTTVDDILGNTNYYNDRNAFRRYSLLTTAMDTYGGMGRGNGVYLAGWTSAAPVSAREQTLTVPPGLMTWAVLDPGQTGSPSPYDMYLYPGANNYYALRFMPAQLLLFSQARQLTLHLSSYGVTGPAGVLIDLWDFTENTWVSQPALMWGDNEIEAPARFVGPGGEIQVRVALPGASSQLNLETLDFTLVVDR